MTGYLWRGRPALEEQNAAIMAARPGQHPGRGRQTGAALPSRGATRACPQCGGSGVVWVTRQSGPDHKQTCPKCNGTGKVPG